MGFPTRTARRRRSLSAHQDRGHHALIGLEVIEVEVPGLIYGRNRGDGDYLLGDTLELEGLRRVGQWYVK